MKRFHLKRVSRVDFATFGVMLGWKNVRLADGEVKPFFVPFCGTVELPWKDNEKDVSCMPPGLWKMVRSGPTKNIPYPHVKILVTGRDGCAVHKANLATQLRGCVAVGERFELMDDPKTEAVEAVPGVSESGRAFEEFMAIFGDDEEAELLVTDA